MQHLLQATVSKHKNGQRDTNVFQLCLETKRLSLVLPILMSGDRTSGKDYPLPRIWRDIPKKNSIKLPIQRSSYYWKLPGLIVRSRWGLRTYSDTVIPWLSQIIDYPVRGMTAIIVQIQHVRYQHQNHLSVISLIF